jgi:hypothetical protein
MMSERMSDEINEVEKEEFTDEDYRTPYKAIYADGFWWIENFISKSRVRLDEFIDKEADEASAWQIAQVMNLMNASIFDWVNKHMIGRTRIDEG